MAFTLRNNLRKAIFILLLLSPFILSEDPTEIDIENETTFKLKEKKTLKIKLNNSHDYYKITIKKHRIISDIEVDQTNYLLSYYQKDREFKNRKQFTQGEGKVEMWLSKAQVDNEFYIEIEKDRIFTIEVTMDINLDRYNNTELEIEKQFNYYVSEENQMMKFKMKEIPDRIKKLIPDVNNYILTVWVKGNKNISSKLEGISCDRPSEKYNYYRINMTDLVNKTFELTVNGTINDLINIGTLIFHKETDEEGEIYATVELFDTLDGLELAVFLKPNERVSFKYRATLLGPLGYLVDINNNLQNLNYIGVNEFSAMKTHNFTSSEESFYIIQLPPKTSPLNKFYIDYPEIIGVNYFRMISPNRNIGILPMKIDNFKFFTYEIIPLGGEIEVSIYDCEDYPSCSLNTTNKLSDYETFSYTFRKDDWDDEISPMSKKQKMLSISCKSGISLINENFCAVSTIMRTDENIIPTQLVYYNFTNQEFPVTRYIKKGDKNVYEIKKNLDVYMNIEILSGKAEITTEPEINDKFVEGNKKLFKIGENQNVKITIKASKDCVYRIIDYDSMLKNNYLLLGSSYLFNLKEKMNLRPYGYLEDRLSLSRKYYLGIYPIDNCKFEVESYEKNNNTDFYQFISNNLNNFYNITKSDLSSTSPCLFYTSNYKLDNKMGISLEEYSNQTILFNKDNKEFYFSFAHVQKDKNVSINFVLDKEDDSFKVKIKLNDKEYNSKEIEINFEERTIELKASDIQDKCENFYPVCKILISVTSNKEEETLLTIGINDEREDNEGNEEEEEKDEEEENGEEERKKSDNNSGKTNPGGNKDDGDDDDDKVLIIVLCSVGVVLIVGIVITIILCRTKSENKNLADTVNKISFQDEDGRDTLLG